MKICVADDEKQVRESIVRKLIDCHPYGQVFDVGFGQEAFDCVVAVRPDLLFVDIRMPELDGLSMLRAVKRFRPQTEVVVLSGYGEFDYARTALQGGALDYLLKPADRKQLRRLVRDVYERLCSRFEEQVSAMLARELEPFASGGMSPVVCGANLSPWFDERVGKTIRIVERPDAEARTRLLLPEGEPFPSSGTGSVIGIIGFGDGEAIVTVASASAENASFRRVEEFPQAWTAAYGDWEAKRFFGPKQTPGARRQKPLSASEEAVQARRQVLQAVYDENPQQLEQATELWLRALEAMRVDSLRRECGNLLTMLDDGVLAGRGSGQPSAEAVRRRTAVIATTRTWTELRGWLRDTLCGYMPADREARDAPPPDAWEAAMRVLEDRAGPVLTLEEAAARAGIHPVTFSRLFKQHNGTNFVRYMAQRRMDKARELLLEGRDSVTAIAEKVGYADLRYFSRLFKQSFGVTPGNYRKRNGRSPHV
ncbi:response regulator transcription factor [Paenibacillus sp. GCM10023250]|uniref:response regulator transcription factor n=1 Tax=Paenibacillus sp. GCM10023250 TaxID=3252648 RepID=UPI003610A420